ncbi:MAG: argininosuccinate synthase [Planctomycetaceae bacterium]|nr:argininosuccinate synthase [Planctomycetota bacterium]NUO15450.1 argininosuccinate synthase [Planctomycetaceae bacterium]GIK54068.1 MAG: argininosuccinate synthase [Planctomycetota bacterium]
MSKSTGLCVLAFSGGLDTSFCIPFIREKYGYDVATAMVDTGGFSADDFKRAEDRARKLGVVSHVVLDGKQQVFDGYVRWMIAGNVLRGGVYPLCVAAERVVQASLVAQYAVEKKAASVAHGSTGAGNDQIRFDVAMNVLAPGLKMLAPVREHSLSRAQETEYLAKHGLEIPPKTTAYSINAGMWGITIGGKETHDSASAVPDEIFEMAARSDPNVKPRLLKVRFDKGVPVALDGAKLKPVDIIENLNTLGCTYALGRGIHLGDTIVGIKGRVAFVAPAALMLINAHRELEKLVLTKWQRFWKDHVADFYGTMLHEGQPFDPSLRDIEALFQSSQERVSGEVSLTLRYGRFDIAGVSSPHSLMNAASGKYGEEFSLWSGQDAAGFGKILSIPSRLYGGAGASR